MKLDQQAGRQVSRQTCRWEEREQERSAADTYGGPYHFSVQKHIILKHVHCQTRLLPNLFTAKPVYFQTCSLPISFTSKLVCFQMLSVPPSEAYEVRTRGSSARTRGGVMACSLLLVLTSAFLPPSPIRLACKRQNRRNSLILS